MQLVDNAGGWFNYVATLALVDRLSQGSSVAISMVLIVRFLPFAFFFPIAGVVADRYAPHLGCSWADCWHSFAIAAKFCNALPTRSGLPSCRYRREVVLIVTCLLDAGIVALLALAQWLPYIW